MCIKLKYEEQLVHYLETAKLMKLVTHSFCLSFLAQNNTMEAKRARKDIMTTTTLTDGVLFPACLVGATAI